MRKKITGSYYTPPYLAQFISDRVFNVKKKTISVLEPSVGDGVFINSILNKKEIEITALDINESELLKAKEKWAPKEGEFIVEDFLVFETKKKFDLVLGNPPYIKRNRLTPLQIQKCENIHKRSKLSDKSIKNIWTSFLIKSSRLLKEDGILAFVLPLELLQVKFAEELRVFLKNSFQRIEILTFDDLMFECKGQDTMVLIAYKKAVRAKGVYYANIDNTEKLTKEKLNLQKNETLTRSDIKWTNHILSSDDISFLNNIRSQLNSIDDYCESKPGIVTAANSYFIVNKETEENYSLNKYTLPIIQKGLFVNGSIVFGKKDYEKIFEAGLPSKFVSFKNEDEPSMLPNTKAYLEIGLKQEIQNRYKCKLRKNWFVVPNVATQPQGFFLKRSHLYPKLIKNTAKVFVTDSAYKVNMKYPFDINSLIFSFYNSLTFLFAEMEGRYYGGGVLELVPSEFKRLPLPYVEITSIQFKSFQRKFENKKNIEAILKSNNLIILKTVLNLSINDIVRIERIWKKLQNKRLKKSSIS